MALQQNEYGPDKKNNTCFKLGGRAFRNLNPNEMVHVFNKTIENIRINFIAHETIF